MGLTQAVNPAGPEICQEVLRSLSHPIRCFALEILAKGEEGEEETVNSLVELMVKYGVNPDQENLIGNMTPILLPWRERNMDARTKNAAESAEARNVS